MCARGFGPPFIEARASWLHRRQNMNIAVLIGIAARHRPEDARIVRAMLRRNCRDFSALFADQCIGVLANTLCSDP